MKDKIVIESLLTLSVLLLASGWLWFHFKKKKRLLRVMHEKEIFRLARLKNGKLSIADIIAETSLDTLEAESLLEDMSSNGYIGITVMDTGMMLYEFYDINSKNTSLSQPATQMRTAVKNEQFQSRPFKNPGNKNPVMPQILGKRLWLLKSARLYDKPGGNEVGAFLPGGSEFEYTEKDKKGWYRLKDIERHERWIKPIYATTQDPRSFFNISDRPISGYLVELYSDMSGGDMKYITINDNLLGEIKIATNKIEAIVITSEDQNNRLMAIETFNGKHYSGQMQSTKYYLMSDEAMIKLNDIRNATLLSRRL
ncbi:hypothetical protein QUF90_16145 [Desulfococcaceae bacterium HSG9]|nr:hypothetical protein [Desulfococcaceae bacterium HSG9]